MSEKLEDQEGYVGFDRKLDIINLRRWARFLPLSLSLSLIRFLSFVRLALVKNDPTLEFDSLISGPNSDY